MNYLGAVVAGQELVHIWVSGRDARFQTIDPIGNINTFQERLKGTLPMRLAALHYLLDAAPPGTNFLPVHGEPSFFEDWRESTVACTLLTED